MERFCDITDMRTLLPRAATGSELGAEIVMENLEDPLYVAQRAELHAQGYVQNSPFVSLGEDVSKMVSTTDPGLKTIITGSPGAEGYARAPHIATFWVPENRLITPLNPLSGSETEKLFLGTDLPEFLISARPNPY